MSFPSHFRQLFRQFFQVLLQVIKTVDFDRLCHLIILYALDFILVFPVFEVVNHHHPESLPGNFKNISA